MANENEEVLLSDAIDNEEEDAQDTSEDVAPLLPEVNVNEEVAPEPPQIVEETDEIQGDTVDRPALRAGPNQSLGRIESPVPIPDEGDSSLIGATFRETVSLGQFLANSDIKRGATPDTFEDRLDRLKFVPKEHEDNWHLYLFAEDRDAADRVTDYLDQKKEDQAKISQHPVGSFALMIPLQLAGPENYLPGGIAYKSFKAASRISRAAASGGAAGAFSGVVSESIFAKYDPLYDFDSTQANILASTIFSGMISGGGAYFGPKFRSVGGKLRDTAIQDIEDGILNRPPPTGDDIRNRDGIALNNIEKIVLFQSPRNRLFRSENPIANNIADTLYINDFVTWKNKNGHESKNVEARLKHRQGIAKKALIDVNSLFLKQAGIDKGPFKNIRSNFLKEDGSYKYVSRQEFGSAIGRVIRDKEPSANSEVNEAAAIIQGRLFEPAKQDIIKIYGLNPEWDGPANAEGWLLQAFNSESIKKDPEGFEKKLRKGYSDSNNAVKAVRMDKEWQDLHRQSRKLDEQRKKLGSEDKKEISRLKKEIKALDEKMKEQAKIVATKFGYDEKSFGSLFHSKGPHKGKLRGIRQKHQIEEDVNATFSAAISNRMLGADIIIDGIEMKRGSLKDRRFLLKQSDFDEYLRSDIFEIASIYERQVYPQIELEKFAQEIGYTGYVDWYNSTIKLIEKKFAADRKGLSKSKLDKLTENKDKDKEDIKNSFRLLLGVYGQMAASDTGRGAKALRSLLSWNYVRLLGGMTISSIPDVGLHVFTHGLYSTMWDGLRPFIKSSIGLMESMPKDDLNAIGVALNTALGTRAMQFANLDDVTTSTSLFGRVFDNFTTSFGNLVFANQWNDIMQTMAGTMSVNRTLKTVEKILSKQEVSQIDLQRIARLGIGPEDYAPLYNMWKKYGINENGTYLANWSKWKFSSAADARATKNLQMSAMQEIQSVVIEPGLGDKPLIAQTGWGKLLLQFKNFMLASHNKVFMAGLQRKMDPNVYLGIVAMAAMGDLSYIIQQSARGNRELDLSFENLALEAFTRSGLTTMASEVYNILALAGFGVEGAASQYQTRGIVGALLGPTSGLITDIAGSMNSFRKLLQGEQLSFNEIEQHLRLYPTQNVFWSWYPVRSMIHGTALKAGIEKHDNTGRYKDIFK